MEHHPDKNRNNEKHSDSTFKRIREAYDVLSDPASKRKYDEHGKLIEKYNDFVNESKNEVDSPNLEDAFNQLIKGEYPSWKSKRQKKEDYRDLFEEKLIQDPLLEKSCPNTAKFELKDINKIRGVESFRQKVYVDDSWRKITKSEHIVVHISGQRIKILTKRIQYPDGKAKIKQKVTPL